MKQPYGFAIAAQANLVAAEALAAVLLFGDGFDGVAFVDGFEVRHAAVDAHGFLSVGVGGKGQGAVGQRIGYAAVGHFETVAHARTYAHLQSAVTRLRVEYIYAQPPTKGVVGHHVIYDGRCHSLGVSMVLPSTEPTTISKVNKMFMTSAMPMVSSLRKSS